LQIRLFSQQGFVYACLLYASPRQGRCRFPHNRYSCAIFGKVEITYLHIAYQSQCRYHE